MKLTKNSEKIINYVKSIPNVDIIPILENNVIFTHILQKLYNFHFLTESTQHVIEYNRKQSNQDLYVAYNTKSYVHCYSFIVTAQNGTNCTVQLFFDTRVEQSFLASIVKRIIVAIELISAYSKSSMERLDIEIIFTDFKKTLPKKGTPLDTQHINSAFVTNCSPQKKMLIFRKEEWLKVFIHELLHAFNIDFSCDDQSENDTYLQSLFPLKNDDFRLYETYTELWALLIHCCFVAFYDAKDKKNIYSIFDSVKLLFSHESLFTRVQFHKIMNHYNLTLSDITNGSDHYNEKTHVLSYFIFKYFCILNINQFVKLCSSGNTKISFSLAEKNSKQFIDFIYQSYMSLLNDDSSALDFMNKKNRFVSNTLRMSTYEMI